MHQRRGHDEPVGGVAQKASQGHRLNCNPDSVPGKDDVVAGAQIQNPSILSP